MSDLLKPEHFESLTVPLVVMVKVGEALNVVELTVRSVQLRPPHRFRDAPFSVTMTGPRTPSLPQGTYAVQHPDLGVVDLFIVPAGRDAHSTQYELIFN